MPEPARIGEKAFRGIPVSVGVCRGKILVLGSSLDSVPTREISEEEVSSELHRLEQALVQTRLQVLEVQRKVEHAMGAEDASIFDAHLLVLEDRTLLDEVTRLVTEQKLNVEQAFQRVAYKYSETLSAIDDEYLRERASDLRDITSRILNNLMNRPEGSTPRISEPCIIISHDLPPSTAALFDRGMVLGFATDTGSRTSHTAILARSLHIPAVVGLRDVSTRVSTGQYALLDAYNGNLIINPTDQTLFEYGQLVRKQVNLEEKLRDVRDKPAVTLDGTQIMLSANIEQAEDAQSVTDSGAAGVGLFRTEYLFIHRSSMPTEEEQYEAYRKVAAALKPQPVVIRTLDLGGDKFLSHLQLPQEMNPFLGWRAIRFCLEEKEIFRAHLRAILRASAEGNVKLMYPMISCVRELLQANALVEQYKAELRAENLPFDEGIEIGVMIEIPSAALTADSLARHAKFFSIGTNDLVQYSLAVDRLNERIAHLYEPTHPAIISLIKMTVDAAHRNGIWVGVCGEMAGDPALVPLLLGLGVDELSATPTLVPEIKFLIRRLRMKETRELADFALQSESGPEILEKCRLLVRQVAPNLVDFQNGVDA